MHEWKRKGICAKPEYDTSLWYPEDIVSKVRRTRVENKAKSICKECEVKPTCLRFAIDNNEVYGVWGGKAGHERRKMK